MRRLTVLIDTQSAHPHRDYIADNVDCNDNALVCRLDEQAITMLQHLPVVSSLVPCQLLFFLILLLRMLTIFHVVRGLLHIRHNRYIDLRQFMCVDLRMI